MTKEEDDSNLQYIADVVWEDRYLTQITELHVVAALLIPQNHNIKVIEVFTEQAFSFIMHRFFGQYLKVEDARLVIKQ